MFPYRGFVIRLGCDRGVLLSGRCAFSRGWGREGARVGVGCVLLRKTSGAPGREGCFGEGGGGVSKSVYDVLVRIFGNWI